MRLRMLLMLSCAFSLSACERDTQAAPAAVLASKRFEAPQFDDPHLRAGRDVWIGTCMGCHDIGVGGAPPIGDRAAWRERIEQGLPTLYAHALQGFFGSRGTLMPARGGNDTLSDEQVRAAVDYMTTASR